MELLPWPWFSSSRIASERDDLKRPGPSCPGIQEGDSSPGQRRCCPRRLASGGYVHPPRARPGPSGHYTAQAFMALSSSLRATVSELDCAKASPVGWRRRSSLTRKDGASAVNTRLEFQAAFGCFPCQPRPCPIFAIGRFCRALAPLTQRLSWSPAMASAPPWTAAPAGALETLPSSGLLAAAARVRPARIMHPASYRGFGAGAPVR